MSFWADFSVRFTVAWLLFFPRKYMTIVSLANRKKEEVLESWRPHTFAYITGSIVSDTAAFFTFKIPSTFSCTLWWNLPAPSKAIQKRSPSVVVVQEGGSKIDLHSSPVDTLCYSFLDWWSRSTFEWKEIKKKKKKRTGERANSV